MLQSFAQLRVALLDFLEQPHVCDRDDCLIGEGLEQSDLFFRERPRLRSTNQNGAKGNTLTEQRRGKCRPNAEAPSITRW